MMEIYSRHVIEVFENKFDANETFLTRIYFYFLQIVLDMIFISLNYFLTSQPSDFIRFSRYCLICILVAFSSEGFGWIIGALLDSVVSINVQLDNILK